MEALIQSEQEKMWYEIVQEANELVVDEFEDWFRAYGHAEWDKVKAEIFGFDKVEIGKYDMDAPVTPTAPSDRNGNVSPSSPECTISSSPQARRSSLTRAAEPPASLMEKILARLRISVAQVSAAISTPQRPGTE